MVSTTAPPVAATLNTLAVLSNFNLDRKIGEQNQTINNALADRRRALDQVKKCEKSAVETAWSLGKLLNEKKGRLGHGAFLPWLEKVGISSSASAKYMKLAGQISTRGNLGPSISATIRALEPPKTPAAVVPETAEPDPAAVIAALEDDLGTAQERIGLMGKRCSSARSRCLKSRSHRPRTDRAAPSEAAPVASEALRLNASRCRPAF